MKNGLLKTKLYIPPPRPRLVDRPRLILRLNEGLEQGCKLVLVSAPVGYGKTTLVSKMTAFFGKTASSLNLATEDIAILGRRTEGWVAGLQLAALSLQNTADTAAFIQDFAGDDRYVVDYLIGEVIDRQPAPIQEFLLKTAFLDRFTASLCDAVTGQENGRDCLAHLQQADLFLISLDNKGEWYRYHHLFVTLLRYQLKEAVGVEGIKELHRRAAAWYAQNGFTEAVQANTYAAQGRLHQATRLYEETIDYGLKRNGGRPFPPAGYAYAGLGQVAYQQDDLEKAERLLDQAVELGERIGDWSMIRRGLLPLAWIKQMQGEGTTAHALWQRALDVVQQADSARVEAHLRVHQARLWLAQATTSAHTSALALATAWADGYQQGMPVFRICLQTPRQFSCTFSFLAAH